MGKKHRRKSSKKNYYKNNIHNKEKRKEATLLVIFIVAFFLLLWVLFWIGVIIAIIGTIYFAHKVNDYFKLYNTEYYSGAILTFLISALIILFGGTQIVYNMGKINNTFWGWAIETSDYIKLSNSKGKTSIKPNVEGVIQKGAINSITSTGSNLK